MVSFLQSLLLLFHFCVFLSQLSEPVWKLAEEISLQSTSKRLPSSGPPANGNNSNAKKSRFRPNWNLPGTIYHWSVILRSFSVVLNSAKRNANGVFKVLLLSSHLLNSRHPVQKSKFGACAVTRYCSFISQHISKFIPKLIFTVSFGINFHLITVNCKLRNLTVSRQNWKNVTVNRQSYHPITAVKRDTKF